MAGRLSRASIALRVCAVATFLVAAFAQPDDDLNYSRPASLPLLPLSLKLPGGCGAVYQVRHSDTCQSVADYAGLTLSEFQKLNPLTLCGVLPLSPGAPVCSGDKLAFCNNRYVATADDSCTSIANDRGQILALPTGQTCTTLRTASSVDVCIAPTENACAVDKLCDVSITPALQQLLGTVPDYCSIIKECKAPIKIGTTLGKDSLSLSLTKVTTALTKVLGNKGHPELQGFVDAVAVNPAQLVVTFVPGGLPDDSNMISFVGSAVGVHRRKLLQGTSYPPTGTMGTPRPRYYG